MFMAVVGWVVVILGMHAIAVLGSCEFDNETTHGPCVKAVLYGSVAGIATVAMLEAAGMFHW
jgi:hypothetical protein